MRRIEKQISELDAIEILNKGEYGTLALTDEKLIPYSIPVNYVYENNHIYFHSSNEGLKIDMIKRNPNVCFSVVTKSVVDGTNYNTYYESVIAFGKASILEDKEDKFKALYSLCMKFSKEVIDKIDCLYSDLKSVCLVDIEIISLTGKRN